MGTIIYNIMEYLEEFIKLFIFLYFVLRLEIKKSKKTFLILGMTFVVIMSISAFFDIGQFGISYALILVTFIFFVLKEKKKIALVILSYVLICIIDMTMCVVIMHIANISYNQLEDSRILKLALNAISIIVILVMAFFNKIFGKDRSLENISLKYIGLMTLGCLAVALYMTYVVVTATNSKDGVEFFTALVFGLSGVIFVVVCILLMYNKNKNEQLKYEAKIMSQLVKSQEAYYTMLLQKEDETKQFRHDVKNHLYCMQILFEDEKFADLKNYFGKINDDLRDLSPSINTGNRLVNVILNEIMSRYDDVSLKWTG